jgi:hypothetical protein
MAVFYPFTYLLGSLQRNQGLTTEGPFLVREEKPYPRIVGPAFAFIFVLGFFWSGLVCFAIFHMMGEKDILRYLANTPPKERNERLKIMCDNRGIKFKDLARFYGEDRIQEREVWEENQSLEVKGVGREDNLKF